MKGFAAMWISVLEDESTLNRLITKYLEKEGYQVRVISPVRMR